MDKPATQEQQRFGPFTFEELNSPAGLARLDEQFRAFLSQRDTRLAEQLSSYRSGDHAVWPAAESEFLLDLARHVEPFVAGLFGIEGELATLTAQTRTHNLPVRFKAEFVQKRARKFRDDGAMSFAELDRWLLNAAGAADAAPAEQELAIAGFALGLLDQADANAEAIGRVTAWCRLVQETAEGLARIRDWPSFRLPQRIDPAQRVALSAVPGDDAGRMEAETTYRQRDGFGLSDSRMGPGDVQSEVGYCVYCHDHEGDFCSIGFPAKKGKPELGYKIDPLGVELTGCPLEERISEMHLLKRDGHAIAALAMASRDNPMLPATGHRICNDCMKSCIYQKQDPVNIPQIETRVLTDVLNLPWGVEIYHLLTRWNPLRPDQYLARAYNGRKVLIAGMGPAGFTMAHHLTMAGCAVVGVDGLKIEPLPESLLSAPVREWQTLVESLDERILLGFGGVAEYGITVRWDKNFLKLIYLTLARRAHFQVFGGVRLGGTVTVENAWEMGFDHLCIATGAGLPRVVPMENSLARGMRQANDFLMALQLTGAGKTSSLANLQVRLPAVVIGGGLTAIDTATEVQTYYIRQVEKTLAHYETLVAAEGAEAVSAGLNDEDRGILDEFVNHGRAVRAERERATKVGEMPDFIKLIRSWGGVTLTYRKNMTHSPAYVRNHEEIIQAMEEGLYYAECLSPVQAGLDRFQHVESVTFERMAESAGRWAPSGEYVTLPARSVFVAAGTVPNTIYETEHPGTFDLQGNHFQPHIGEAGKLQPVTEPAGCKSESFGPLTSYSRHGRRVSFLGDTHPAFNGSVVKAIASARRSFPVVLDALESRPPVESNEPEYAAFRAEMAHRLSARVAAIDTANPALAEIWIEAPMAARNFRPGQFYRLQTYESFSPIIEHTRLQIPVLTVSGTGVRGDQIRLLVLQWGSSPRLVGRLKPGDPVVLMGPTGAPTDIPSGENVMIVAGRWGAAVMRDIGPALRAGGNRVIYVAAFAHAKEVDNQAELEAGADQIIWCTATGPRIPARRPQDLSLESADIIDVISRYGRGELSGDHPADHTPTGEVTRLMVMGGTNLLRGFQQGLKGPLGELFPKELTAVGTVGSPMQCMLKGVCSQCLQWQIDPESGQRTRAVFSCAQQDQPLFWIDLDNLAARQQQNRLVDRLTAQWLSWVLKQAS
ncbi:MAG: FAD-dependent oxidoreductase [Pseudomonadota bacterium]|nr:FAD-dependent oxidoreductase [Pseudomonadota bacterium]